MIEGEADLSDGSGDKFVFSANSLNPDAGKYLRVIVCGSRDWTDRAEILAMLSRLPKSTVIIHGDNGVVDKLTGRVIRGADKLAGEVAAELGMAVEKFPADFKRYGKPAGPIRNRQMLAEGKPDAVLAFAFDDPPTGGTGDMTRQAIAAGLPVRFAIGQRREPG